MENSSAVLIAPAIENRTVAPLRQPNAALRTREHLTVGEVERLIEAANANRQGHRDALMMLLAFRHGLRAAEVCDLRWEQIDFATATLHVRRIKNGTPATHPLTGRELRALRRHQRARANAQRSSLCRSAELRYQHQGSRGWSSGLGVLRTWGLRPTPTCFGMPVATHWPTRGTIRARCRRT